MPKKQVPLFDLDAFSLRLSSESDRACAVLGAAVLDVKLESIFRRRLREFQKELLEGSSPLATFSARIRLARALSWISADACGDLDTIRRIRNDFAHSADHDLGFVDASISARCLNLKTAAAFLAGFDDAAAAPHRQMSARSIFSMRQPFEPPRKRFEVTVEFLAQYLDAIPGDESDYTGADLLTDVRALSANTRLEIKALGTVGAPVQPALEQSDEHG